MRSCRRFLAGIPHLRAGTHVLLTRPPLPTPKRRTFDLHVLGTPPAFILSQDQTRHSVLYLHIFGKMGRTDVKRSKHNYIGLYSQIHC